MASSRQLAGLVGPTIVAMIASKFPSVQPHVYDTQIPPVVYLSGVNLSSRQSSPRGEKGER
jgi:hypothetical protein